MSIVTPGAPTLSVPMLREPVEEPPGDVELVVASGVAADRDRAAYVRRLVVDGVDDQQRLLAAVRAARGHWVVLSTGGAEPSAAQLRALLTHAGDDTLPVLAQSGASSSGDPDADGAAYDAAAAGLAAGSPVLLPRAVARRLERLPSPGADGLATWTALAVAHHLRAVPVVDPDGAVAAPPAAEAGLGSELDALTALETTRPASETTYALVRAARRWIGTQMHARLIDHDDEQGPLLEEVRRRDLRSVPWDLVNAGRARDLAVLFAFPPALNPSSFVAARRLRGRGLVTDVVTQDMSDRATDRGARRMVEEVLDEVRTLPGPRSDVQWPPTRDFVEGVLGEVADLRRTKSYRSLYTRAFPAPSHVAGAVLKLRDPDLHWVAEFSDPLRFNPYGEERVGDIPTDALHDELAAGLRRLGHPVPGDLRYFAWCEWVAFCLADELVFTNAHQLDFMIGRIPDASVAVRARSVARAEHHPVPTPELYDRARSAYDLEPGRTHLAYFGSFYPNRGPGLLLDAMHRLRPDERERVQLHVFTEQPEPLRLQVIEAGLADVVQVNDQLGYLEYLHATTRFDVLVLTDYQTAPHYVPNPYLPSKYADYAGAGVRTWCVVEAGSVASGLPASFHTPLGDVAAMARVLGGLAAEHGPA